MDVGFGSGSRITAPTAFIALHQVHPNGGILCQGLIQIRSKFLVIVIAHRGTDAVLRVELGRFADLVDNTTRLPTPEEHRTRTAQHIDLL